MSSESGTLIHQQHQTSPARNWIRTGLLDRPPATPIGTAAALPLFKKQHCSRRSWHSVPDRLPKPGCILICRLPLARLSRPYQETVLKIPISGRYIMGEGNILVYSGCNFQCPVLLQQRSDDVDGSRPDRLLCMISGRYPVWKNGAER